MFRTLLLMGVLFIIWQLFAQIFFPAWKGTKIFPAFRKRIRELENQSVDINMRKSLAMSKIAIAKDSKEVYNLEQEAEELKNIDVQESKTQDE